MTETITPFESDDRPAHSAQTAAFGAAEAAQDDFEALTIAEMLAQLRRAPRRTLREIIRVARAPQDQVASPAEWKQTSRALPPPVSTSLPAQIESRVPAPVDADDWRSFRDALILFALRGAAAVLAIYGTWRMLLHERRTEEEGLYVGLPFLLLGMLVWFVTDGVVEAVLTRSKRSDAVSPTKTQTVIEAPPQARRAGLARIGLAAVGAVFTVLSGALNLGNEFTLEGVVAWGASIILWVWVFAPTGWTPLTALRDLPRASGRLLRRLRFSWTLLALAVVIAVGAYFRLVDLSLAPREMTSDHVEMLLDAQRVVNGDHDVFFASNGGREPLQFYALALFSQLPGQSMSFDTVKLLNALEGILTLPILWWCGRVLIGPEQPRLGNLVGLGMAAMVAVSHWHVSLSRLGERIVLTPLFMSLLVIAFTHALRSGRRSDYVIAGLVLGFSAYTYQVFRLVPIAIAAGLVMVWLAKRPVGIERRTLARNGLALIVVAVVVFAPLFAYSLQYPEDFWRRASTRLFGDALMQEEDEAGNLIFRTPTLEERIEAFQQNLPILTQNIRNALLMYNWKGDVAWWQNAPNEPAMDYLVGGLFAVGAAAWLARVLRRRDVADMFVPIAFFVLVLPSVSSIAYPIENPSATRMSGTMPLAYLFAAFALALLLRGIMRLIPGLAGKGVAAAISVALIAASYGLNHHIYFDIYAPRYEGSSLPYSAGGAVLRAFAEEGPGYGNAFAIAYPYWWDHRALGMAAGVLDFPNGIPSLENVPRFLYDAERRSGAYRLNVDEDILFFYSPRDFVTEEWLRATFPAGFGQIVTTYQEEDDFAIYRVPALGRVGFEIFLRANGLHE